MSTNIKPEGQDQGLHREAIAMNQIAVTLGFDGAWDPVDVGDYLEFIADQVAGTGRPDPGLDFRPSWGSEDQYSVELREFARDHPVPHDQRAAGDWHLLNQIGRTLAGHQWQWSTLRDVAEAVGRSGRPHPGIAPSGTGYIDALNAWAAKSAVPGVDRDPFVGLPSPPTPGVARPGTAPAQNQVQGPGL